jgi:hypothetical protein
MKKLIFLIGMLIIIAPSIALCGAASPGDFPVLAQQSQEGSQGQSQPMTRSQDWPNVQGSGTPYGTPTQESTTPGYPRPKEAPGRPYGDPVTPEKQRQQGGSDMGSQGWPNIEGQGAPYGTPTQKSTTPGYPRPQEKQGLPYGSPVTPEGQQQGGSQSR